MAGGDVYETAQRFIGALPREQQQAWRDKLDHCHTQSDGQALVGELFRNGVVVEDSAPGRSLLGAPFWGAGRGGPDSALPQPLGRYLQLPLPAQIPSEGGYPISRGSGTGRAAPPRPHSSRQGEALGGRTPPPRPQRASLENPNNDFPTVFRNWPCTRPTFACAPAPRAPPARAAPAGTPLLPGAGDARSPGGGPRERSRAAAGRWSRLRPHLSKLAGG